jgi:hypothetical protein
MSIANKIIPHYTYEDWIHWEGSWELIEGHPIAMSPTPIPAHQRVAAELTTALTLALRQLNAKIVLLIIRLIIRFQKILFSYRMFL